MTLSETAVIDGPGDHGSSETQRASVADPIARQLAHAIPSGNAGGGIAHATSDHHVTSGDPESFDPTHVLTEPVELLSDRGGGQSRSITHASDAAANSSRPAQDDVSTSDAAPGQGGGQTSVETQSSCAVAHPIEPATRTQKPKAVVRALRGGQSSRLTHGQAAPATPFDPTIQDASPDEAASDRGDGQPSFDTHAGSAVATLVDLWRQRVDLRRAEGRLHLQALAVCRRALGGDKEAAQKLWKLIQKGQGDRADVALVVEPYRIASATLDKSATALEKEMVKRVRNLPLWTDWARGVRGLGELSVAGLIGEASGRPGDYRSVSALWKRFGLAVFDGQRQRRHADAQLALLHGYAPQRRAFAYVISANLMKSQGEAGPYRLIYDARKAYELAREIPKAHAHNRALRVMVKSLLKDLWAADRRTGANA